MNASLRFRFAAAAALAMLAGAGSMVLRPAMGQPEAEQERNG
jgi:hypothetical protein